jgi:hypothetical protein
VSVAALLTNQAEELGRFWVVRFVRVYWSSRSVRAFAAVAMENIAVKRR